MLDSPDILLLLIVSIFRVASTEPQATTTMRWPHTVELFDFGVAQDVMLYYLMELLDGLDLDRLVALFGPLPAERVVHMLIQVYESLGEAHGVGIIHRDIKPANLYACRFGRATDWMKVLDFGLVKNSLRKTSWTGHPRTWHPSKCWAYLLTREEIFTPLGASRTDF